MIYLSLQKKRKEFSLLINIMKKLKLIAKEFAAVIIVGTGVKLISVYLTNDLDIISIISGLLGFTILFPAIIAYVDLIDKVISGEE